MSKAPFVIGDGKFASKNGGILAYNEGDVSNRIIANELTIFDRGSDQSATRINKDGLVEQGRENLFLQSNNFTTTWTRVRSSIESGHFGYDGSNNAFKFQANDQTASGQVNSLFQDVTLTSGNIFTVSIFAKPGAIVSATPTLRISLNEFLTSDSSTKTNSRAFFNLLDGTLAQASVGNVIDARSEDKGNGFFRFIVTFNLPSTNTADRVVFFLGSGGGTIDANTQGDTIFFQDAQLEVGHAATPVIESGAATGKAGVLIDEPRIDYDSGSAAFLLEPTRKNHVQYSEGATSSWQGNTPTGFGVETKPIISAAFDEIDPAGNKGGVVRVQGIQDVSITSSDRVQLEANSTLVSGGNTYVGSFFVKGTPGETIRYQVKRFGTGDGSFGDQTTGTLDGTWQRMITEPVTLASNNTRVGIMIQKNTLSTANDILLWGGQIEEGSFATSYIPNHGLSAGVTRPNEGVPAAASGVVDLSSFFVGDDVTLVVHFVDNPSVSRDNSSAGIELSNGGAATGKVAIYRNNDAARQLHAVFFGTDGNNVGVPITSSAPKIAIRRVRSSNAFTIYMDGAPLDDSGSATDSNGDFTNSNFDVTWDDLKLSGINSTLKILSLKLFDRALTNPEMQSETQ